MNKNRRLTIVLLILVTAIFVLAGTLRAVTSGEEICERANFERLVRQALDSLAKKEHQEAEAKIMELLKLQPDFALSYMLLAAVYYSQGEEEKAQAAIDKAMQLDPEATTSFINTLDSSPEQLRQETIKILESSDYLNEAGLEEREIRLGYVLYLRAFEGDIEKYDQAIEKFKKALKINPENAKAYEHLGHCYYQKYKYESSEKKKSNYLEEAQLNYEKAARIDPKHLEGLLFLGNVYAANKMHKKLEILYAKVLQLDPENECAREFIGFQERERKRAERLDKLTRKNKELKSLIEERKKMELYHLAEEKYKGDPSNAKVALELGIIYWDKVKDGYKGFSDKAEGMLKKAVELDPTFLVARYKLGEYFLKNNQKEKAAEQFREIMKVDPKFANETMRKAIADVESK